MVDVYHLGKKMNASIIAGIMFLLFSSWLLRYAFVTLRLAERSGDWPGASGNIVMLTLSGTRNVDGEQKPVEKITLEYDYIVDGRRYQGNRAAFYTLVYPDTVVFANQHPENELVTVYYNPDDPTESVLINGQKRGPKQYSDIVLALTGVCVSAAIIILGMMGVIG